MIWRTDKPKGSPIVVYRNGNPRPEVLFLATKPYPHYYDDGGEEIPDGMIQKWASLEESSLPSNLDEAAEEYIRKGKYLPEAFVVRPAFKAGAKLQKEQMMKEAVEGRVSYFESREVAVIYYDDPKGNTMCFFAPSSSLETGDKVRIIIVKED